MPGLVGGFGKENLICLTILFDEVVRKIGLLSLQYASLSSPPFSASSPQAAEGSRGVAVVQGEDKRLINDIPKKAYGVPNSDGYNSDNKVVCSKFGSYLAGFIEGDGTFAVHDKDSTANKYNPMIIIVFKKSDYPLANYLRDITNSGSVMKKQNRGYVLWQIQDIFGVYTIVNIINGYMRTPKIEGLARTIFWLNNYIANNKNSKLPATKKILMKIKPIQLKELDPTPIENNPWLSGFSDADANFSINIHKRSNGNWRVQLYYRLEIKQNYHKLDNQGNKISFFFIISNIGKFLGVNVLSRTRSINDKEFFSYTIIAHNQDSQMKIINYFNAYPLLSSKYLDYKSWLYVWEKQKENPVTTSYFEEAKIIRKDFNKTRTSYNWDHLKDCYLFLDK